MIKEVLVKFSDEKMKQLKKPALGALGAAAIIPAVIALVKKLLKRQAAE